MLNTAYGEGRAPSLSPLDGRAGSLRRLMEKTVRHLVFRKIQGVYRLRMKSGGYTTPQKSLAPSCVRQLAAPETAGVSSNQ